MIYQSNFNVKLKAFQYGADVVPEWAKSRIQRIDGSARCLLVQTSNSDLIQEGSTETAEWLNFVVLTEGGSLQVYTPENFYRIFINRISE